MTKEEEKYTTLDIDQVKWWVNTLFNMAKEMACNSHQFDDAEEIQSAQDKIIKALEQQPSYDCVSRAEAIKELKESAEHHANDTREEVLLRRDRDIIRALPPVTPTRKAGKWIYHFERDDYNDYENEYYECPFCHDLGGDKYYHYCPVCGNKVEGVEDGSN